MAIYIKKEVNGVEQNPKRVGVIPNGYPARKIAKANGVNLEEATTWKLIETVVGTATSIAFPETFEELIVKVKIPYTGYNIATSLHLTKAQLTETAFYDSGSSSTIVRVYADITNKYLILNSVYVNDTIDYSSTSEMSVYYR